MIEIEWGTSHAINWDIAVAMISVLISFATFAFAMSIIHVNRASTYRDIDKMLTDVENVERAAMMHNKAVEESEKRVSHH